MIGHLRGLLHEKRPPYLLLEIQGIGYELEAPMSTFAQLPRVGAEVRLYTHLVVRDDAHLLYGFLTEAERRLFRALIRVTGIGARTALAILSGSEVHEFAACVRAEDIARLTRLPGIGTKTAQRLVVEMRDRLAEWHFEERPGRTRAGPSGDALEDAIAGLIALGYKPQEADRFLQGLDTEGLTSEAIIRAVLRSQAKPERGAH